MYFLEISPLRSPRFHSVLFGRNDRCKQRFLDFGRNDSFAVGVRFARLRTGPRERFLVFVRQCRLQRYARVERAGESYLVGVLYIAAHAYALCKARDLYAERFN